MSTDEKISAISDMTSQLKQYMDSYAAAILPLDPSQMSAEYQVAKSLHFSTPEEKKFNTFTKHTNYIKSMLEEYVKAATIATEVSEMNNVKKGAQFSQKNKENILKTYDMVEPLYQHVAMMKDLVTANESSGEETNNGNKAIAEFLSLESQLY